MAQRIWRLAQDVHAALCGEDLVLLDVSRDQYFCLPQAGANLLLDPALGVLRGLADDLAAELQEANFLTDREVLQPRRWGPPPTQEAFDVVPAPRGRAPSWPDLVAGSLAMLSRYHRRPFADLVGRRRAQRGGRLDIAAAARLGAGFQTSLPWLPVQGACLYQSFLLLDILACHDLRADWVFAVRTWPFAAHCWVQAGDVVLNDTVDYVSSFEPIMVV